MAGTFTFVFVTENPQMNNAVGTDDDDDVSDEEMSSAVDGDEMVLLGEFDDLPRSPVRFLC